jgi:hypothetical protein
MLRHNDVVWWVMTLKPSHPKMQQRRSRGRPRVHREAWTRVSVVLFERQILALDRLTMSIRSKTGATLTRADVIRALLDGLHQSRLDVTTIGSGADLKRLLLQKLG